MSSLISSAGRWRSRRALLSFTAGGTLILALFLINCGVVPRDSAGTLDRVRGGEVRVGAAHHPPWVRIEGTRISGIEPELIERWASQVDASVAWHPGAEAELIDALTRGELDIVAAGFESGTPYGREVALTRPYAEADDRQGTVSRHVLAARPGESALLLSLDRFLASQDVLR